MLIVKVNFLEQKLNKLLKILDFDPLRKKKLEALFQNLVTAAEKRAQTENSHSYMLSDTRFVLADEDYENKKRQVTLLERRQRLLRPGHEPELEKEISSIIAIAKNELIAAEKIRNDIIDGMNEKLKSMGTTEVNTKLYAVIGALLDTFIRKLSPASQKATMHISTVSDAVRKHAEQQITKINETFDASANVSALQEEIEMLQSEMLDIQGRLPEALRHLEECYKNNLMHYDQDKVTDLLKKIASNTEISDAIVSSLTGKLATATLISMVDKLKSETHEAEFVDALDQLVAIVKQMEKDLVGYKVATVTFKNRKLELLGSLSDPFAGENVYSSLSGYFVDVIEQLPLNEKTDDRFKTIIDFNRLLTKIEERQEAVLFLNLTGAKSVDALTVDAVMKLTNKQPLTSGAGAESLRKLLQGDLYVEYMMVSLMRFSIMHESDGNEVLFSRKHKSHDYDDLINIFVEWRESLDAGVHTSQELLDNLNHDIDKICVWEEILLQMLEYDISINREAFLTNLVEYMKSEGKSTAEIQHFVNDITKLDPADDDGKRIDDIVTKFTPVQITKKGIIKKLDLTKRQSSGRIISSSTDGLPPSAPTRPKA